MARAKNPATAPEAPTAETDVPPAAAEATVPEVVTEADVLPVAAEAEVEIEVNVTFADATPSLNKVRRFGAALVQGHLLGNPGGDSINRTRTRRQWIALLNDIASREAV